MLRFFLLLSIIGSCLGPPLLAQVTPSDTVFTLGRPRPDSNAQVIFSGRMVAVATRDFLPGATIKPQGFPNGIQTDDLGQFRLLLFPGTYQMEVSHPDMAPLGFTLNLYRSGSLTIALDYPTKAIEAVVMEAYARTGKVNEVVAGVERMSIGDIRVQPTLLGEVDVVKSLQWLPGVSQVGEGAAGFNVRGGSIDQNLVLLDGATLYNPTHLLGFMSAFHPDAIEGFTLYKGMVPAQYGGRLASVLEVESGPASLDTTQVKLGLGPVAARAAVQGPWGDRTHYLLALRGGYLDWLLPLFDDIPDVRSSQANFQEGQFRLRHSFSDAHRLSLGGYATRDFVQIGNRFNYQYQTQLASLSYDVIVSDRLLLQVQQHVGRYVKTFNDFQGVPARANDNGLFYLPGRAQALWLSDRHQLRGGFNWQYTQGLTEALREIEPGLDLPEQFVARPAGLEMAVFIADEWTLSSAWALSLGLRYTQYRQTASEAGFAYRPDAAPAPSTRRDSSSGTLSQYGGLEPRISLRWKPFETTALRASYHRMQQFTHLISNAAAPTPIDLWLVATDYAPPQVADQYTLGWLQQWAGYRWELSIEGFYKTITGLLEYRDFAQLLGARYLAEQTLPAEGQAYGAEFSLQRMRGRLTGRLSYAYVRALNRTVSPFAAIQVNRGAWYPANYDQPHQVDLLLQYQLTPGSILAWNGVFRSGRPYTPIVGAYYLGPTAVGEFDQRNAGRISPYLRLDVSLTVQQLAQRWDDELVISIYNLLGRENAYSYFFQRPNSSVIPRPFRLAVLGVAFPSVVYNLKF